MEFRLVPGYPNYVVSNTGKVINVNNKHELAQIKSNGYLTVRLWKNNNSKSFYVHRLVAYAFSGVCDLDINHLDGDKTNNNISNLTFVTKAENNKHARDLGLNNSINEKNKQAKLTNKEVKEIKQILNAGGVSQKDIGKAYKVHRSTINNIKHGYSWRNI